MKILRYCCEEWRSTESLLRMIHWPNTFYMKSCFQIQISSIHGSSTEHINGLPISVGKHIYLLLEAEEPGVGVEPQLCWLCARSDATVWKTNVCWPVACVGCCIETSWILFCLDYLCCTSICLCLISRSHFWWSSCLCWRDAFCCTLSTTALDRQIDQVHA